jgi:hypothetical protein
MVRFLPAASLICGLIACKPDDPPVYSSDIKYPLRDFLNEAEFIGVGELAGADRKTLSTGIRCLRVLKGTRPSADLQLKVAGVTPLKLVGRHIVDGSPVVMFRANGFMMLYLNRFFLQVYGDTVTNRWEASSVERQANQTFNGTAGELAEVAEKILNGSLQPPPLDTSLPPIDSTALRDLPDWNAEVSPSRLPAPFRKGAPTPARPQPPEHPESTVEGLQSSVYEGSWGTFPDFSTLTPVENGVTLQPDCRRERKGSRLALRFRGFLEIPRDGDYVFTRRLDPDCFLVLKIGSAEVSPAGPVPEYIPLLAGKYAVVLEYSGAGGEEHYQLFWSGPDLPRQPIPPKAWSRYR